MRTLSLFSLNTQNPQILGGAVQNIQTYESLPSLFVGGGLLKGGKIGRFAKGGVPLGLRINSKKISHAIVHGHTKKHRKKFESIGINTPKQLEKHVRNVIHNPSHFRKLKNDRIMFIDDKTQTVVAYDPHRRDSGSTYIHDPSVTTEKNALEYLLTRD